MTTPVGRPPVQDYLGPISPVSRSGKKYVHVSVDYCTRKGFGRAVATADSRTTVKILREDIFDPFGYPLVVYNNNGRHFRGECSDFFAGVNIEQIFSPPYSPWSVGICERYVALIKFGLQKALQKDHTLIKDWDTIVPLLMRDINQRCLKVGGYTLDQLMFGFNPRLDKVPLEIELQVRREAIKLSLSKEHNDVEVTAAFSLQGRLDKFCEMRDKYTEERIKDHIKTAKNSRPHWRGSMAGDLILLRRFALDGDHGRKLEPRWDGPYVLARLSPNGRSGYIADFHSGKELGRYHLNSLKVFVPRENHIHEGKSWQQMREISLEAKKKV